jgi:hypothetical protein
MLKLSKLKMFYLISIIIVLFNYFLFEHTQKQQMFLLNKIYKNDWWFLEFVDGFKLQIGLKTRSWSPTPSSSARSEDDLNDDDDDMMCT